MNLEEKKDAILLLMDFAVNEEEVEQAIELVEQYRSDHIALLLFHEFYSFLPEARNEAIKILRRLDHKAGTFLLGVTTTQNNYIYLANHEGAEFLGTLEQGIWDEEVLDFFSLSREEAMARYKEIDKFPLYVPVHLNKELCAVCSVSQGEDHHLGCPVEICPWCEGQLANCNCRFSQTGHEQLKTKAQLEDFIKKLEEKGRLPFNPENQTLGGFAIQKTEGRNQKTE